MGVYSEKFSHPGPVDQRLLAWLRAAAGQSPYNVIAYSGNRPGDPRYHGRGMAVDINLVDPKTGKTIPNYQDASSFKTYQDFANLVRAAQVQSDPNAPLRWGGYFSGPKGKYGAMDLMHFDVGDTPMAGGGWDTGLTQQQAALWNLQPGGGTGGSGIEVPPVLPDLLANNVAAPGESSSFPGAEISRSRLRSGDTGRGSLVQGPGASFNPETYVSPETPPSSAIPRGQNSPGIMSPPGLDLASLFQVKDIGQAAVTNAPKFPGRRF